MGEETKRGVGAVDPTVFVSPCHVLFSLSQACVEHSSRENKIDDISYRKTQAQKAQRVPVVQRRDLRELEVTRPARRANGLVSGNFSLLLTRDRERTAASQPE